MNKAYYYIFAFIFICNEVFASSACGDNERTIIFVNGIQNTPKDAEKSRLAIEKALASSTNRGQAEKKKFIVQIVYNPHGFTGKGYVKLDTKEDIKELFIEKASEEFFRDDFRKILLPHNGDADLSKVSAKNVRAYLDDMTPGQNSLEDDKEISDENLKASQKVVSSLIEKIMSNKGVVVVAHSQGNLLANLAWASYVSDFGDDAKKNIRVVNVANTSLFSVNGLNLTHAKDAAIFSGATDSFDKDLSLEKLPSSGRDWTRMTPICANDACAFNVWPPSFNGVDGTPGTLDHAFVETYLSDVDLPDINYSSEDNKGVVFTPGKTRFVDRFEDIIYAAVNSLNVYASGGSEYIFCDEFDRSDVFGSGYWNFYTTSGVNAITSGGILSYSTSDESTQSFSITTRSIYVGNPDKVVIELRALAPFDRLGAERGFTFKVNSEKYDSVGFKYNDYVSITNSIIEPGYLSGTYAFWRGAGYSERMSDFIDTGWSEYRITLYKDSVVLQSGPSLENLDKSYRIKNKNFFGNGNLSIDLSYRAFNRNFVSDVFHGFFVDWVRVKVN